MWVHYKSYLSHTCFIYPQCQLLISIKCLQWSLGLSFSEKINILICCNCNVSINCAIIRADVLVVIRFLFQLPSYRLVLKQSQKELWQSNNQSVVLLLSVAFNEPLRNKHVLCTAIRFIWCSAFHVRRWRKSHIISKYQRWQ